MAKPRIESQALWHQNTYIWPHASVKRQSPHPDDWAIAVYTWQRWKRCVLPVPGEGKHLVLPRSGTGWTGRKWNHFSIFLLLWTISHCLHLNYEIILIFNATTCASGLAVCSLHFLVWLAFPSTPDWFKCPLSYFDQMKERVWNSVKSLVFQACCSSLNCTGYVLVWSLS